MYDSDCSMDWLIYSIYMLWHDMTWHVDWTVALLRCATDTGTDTDTDTSTGTDTGTGTDSGTGQALLLLLLLLLLEILQIWQHKNLYAFSISFFLSKM